MTKQNLTQNLLDWFDRSGRDLPWRFKGGAHPDPYIVLVSEIMLQQTTVKTVLSYFDRFIQRFPTVQTLAAASLEEVFLYWQGLGYYTRAKSLHSSACTIVRDLNGVFPRDEKTLSKLKGLGNYTKASFLALAFNLPETVVDGNVMRIICRLFHRTEPLNELTDWIYQTAKGMTSHDRPADYASAVMDLGAVVCTPKNPQCMLCPLQKACLSKNLPDVEQIPQRRAVSKKEIRANVYIISNERGEVFIRKQTDKGILAGLYEFPWRETYDFPNAKDTGKNVTHILTHLRLNLRIYLVSAQNVPFSGLFVPLDELKNYPFSTLMNKVRKSVFCA